MSEENVPLNMTYQVSCTGSGSASISGNTLNIVAGNTSGTMTVTIQPMIDGIRVGKAKVITIEVKGVEQTPDTGNAGDAGNTGNSNLPELKDLTIDDLASMGINTSGYVSLSRSGDPDELRKSMITSVENYLTQIYNVLNNENIENPKLEAAFKTIKSYFKNYIEDCHFNDLGEEKDHFSYENYGYTENSDGSYTYFSSTSQEWNCNYYNVTYSNIDSYNETMEKYHKDDCDNYNVRLYEVDKWGYNNDAYIIEINRQFIADKFLSFLN